MCGNVFASDKYNTTSNINGVTVNWEYELNDAGQIEYLKCTNPGELTGSIAIPGTLEEKTVVSIGSEAFSSATGITEVILPDSITEIGLRAFEKCTSLNKVDLGSITDIGVDVFEGCTSLTEITIPKTLTSTRNGPALNNPNITKITLEEGLTRVPSNLCANTGITEITIPSSVTEIGAHAFENCTNLNKIDLGNITDMEFDIFKGCTSLTEITIPKTLTSTRNGPVLNNPSITKITLEEGLTRVPSNLCANTGITEITMPSSVTEIGAYAFSDCASLEKITILDNVTEMGYYNTRDEDSVFENHNENLTIYCYKDSMAANYAKKYNIKYEYLTRPATGEGDKDNTNNGASDNSDGNKELPVRLPQAGVNTIIAISFVGIVVVAVIMYKKYKAYKDIK